MYHLLVVEDESLIRRGIRAFIDFDRLGIDEFFEAENGEEGLEAVRSHRIDLILADINMPKMNGLEFCRLAKELDPSIKIAILTGYDYLDYAIRAIKIGVDDYALKPLSRDDVQKLLFHLVEKKKEADNFAAVRQAVDKLAGNAGTEDDSGLRAQMAGILEEQSESAPGARRAGRGPGGAAAGAASSRPFIISAAVCALPGPSTTWNCSSLTITPITPSIWRMAALSARLSSRRVKRRRVMQLPACATFAAPPTWARIRAIISFVIFAIARYLSVGAQVLLSALRI